MSSDRSGSFARGLLLTALALLTVGGCSGRSEQGPTRAAVSGTVMLDGKPLAEGVIRFVPIEGTEGPKTSANISGGRFSVEQANGPVVGKHRIEIESTDTGGYAMDDEAAIQKLMASGIRRIEVVRVPPIYNTHSRLVEMISENGANGFTFDLRSYKRH